MVYFIVGDIDSGKSTRFMSLFEEQEKRIGLFSKKLYDQNDTIIGYNLILLPERNEIPFISLKESICEDSATDYYYRGRFAFRKESFEIGKSYILNNLKTDTSVWIDEIGGLELKGMGYDSLLKVLLSRGKDLVITVRTSLLNYVVERYRISDYTFIEIIK